MFFLSFDMFVISGMKRREVWNRMEKYVYKDHIMENLIFPCTNSGLYLKPVISNVYFIAI